jgi:putative oxidoreductase
MKCAANIVGGLLGLLFIVFGLNFFLNFLPAPGNPPEGSPPALFFGALIPTGYFAFVKSLEILGGVLVAIPKTRNFGLLVLGPIIINILAFHVFLTKGAGFADPVVSIIAILPLFLLWTARNSFKGLLN